MIDGDNEYGAIRGMRIGRGKGFTRRQPAPVPFYPQILHYLTWARSRVAAVGNRWLTAWAMARPWTKLNPQNSSYKPVWIFGLQFFDGKYALQLIRRHTECCVSDGNASDLFYLGGAQFESRPEHGYIHWGFFCFSVVSSVKCRRNNLSSATTTSLNTIYYDQTIRPHVYISTYSVSYGVDA
jgi:hypothetical protein